MNENAVLYVLSTLAQTCAALAAFVGAIGLFLLQSLREQQRAAERALRGSLVDVCGNYDEVVYVLSTAEIVKQVEQLRHEPAKADSAGSTRLPRIEKCFKAWSDFALPIRRSGIVLAVFEGWNLLVILISLGGFAHIPALTSAPWASSLLWLIAAITAVVSGVGVGAFVWLVRSDGSQRDRADHD